MVTRFWVTERGVGADEHGLSCAWGLPFGGWPLQLRQNVRLFDRSRYIDLVSLDLSRLDLGGQPCFFGKLIHLHIATS